MTDKKKTSGSDPLAAHRLRARLAGVERVNRAENQARQSLAGVRRAAGELGHRCGDVEEARALLAEAEASVAKVSDGEQRVKLEGRLGGIRKAIGETEVVCPPIRREP